MHCNGGSPQNPPLCNLNVILERAESDFRVWFYKNIASHVAAVWVSYQLRYVLKAIFRVGRLHKLVPDNLGWHLWAGRHALLVQGELRYPPGNFQETWKFPGVLEKSRGPGFFQVLEISRTPGNFQGSMCIIYLENSRGGYRKVSFSLWMPILSKWIYIQKKL